MDLKDIYLNEGRELYDPLADRHARYESLRNRFMQFVRFFPPPEGGRPFPAGVEFVPEPDKPLLTVRFCGKELRFCFDMVGEQGQVRCLVASPNDVDEEPKELSRFTFNGQGLTNIPPPAGARDADPLIIDSRRTACNIVANFLMVAF